MSMEFDPSSLLQGVMDSKVAMLLYNSMRTQQQEDRSMPDSTRRAFLSRMRADAVTSRQGAQNMEDAATMVTTAQTGVTAIKQMVTDMRRIAADVEANAGTLTADQFQSYSAQLQDYARKIVRTADSTQFNGFQLLNGTAGMGRDGVIQLQAGNSSVQEVLTNMVDAAVADPLKVLDNGRINLKNLEGLMNITDAASASAASALLGDIFKAVAGVEAKYSNDIKSLDNLKVLLESQADIFDNVKKYHSEPTTKEPESYLDALMNSGFVKGGLITGRG